MLGADQLLPCARPGARQPGQQRLPAGLRHRADVDKDLTLAANALQANGIDGQLGELAAEIYARFNQTDAGRDFSAIVTDIRDRSGEVAE